MKPAQLSAHFKSRNPSAIRLAQIEFMKRTDGTEAVNTAIGNVSLPMHPAMQKRAFALNGPKSPFRDGVVKYSTTVGFEETQAAFLNIIASSGFDTKGLLAQITDGGSAAMELVVVGLGGPAGSDEAPLLLIDPAYTNYTAMARRVGRRTVSVRRKLDKSGKYSLPDTAQIEETIVKEKPRAMVVIPYDNPTGHYYNREAMVRLAELCVKYNLWMVSDEAYRELLYTDDTASSIWGLKNKDVEGIEGRRISIETASKVWNACGLRIGAIVTDNPEFHKRSVAENTANLCPNVIGQYIFGSLAHEPADSLRKWYGKQREYYRKMLLELERGMKEKLPGIIASSPDAAIYSVIDVRDVAKPNFDAVDFVMFCAREGKVDVGGKAYTLLVSPMGGFYDLPAGAENPGATQMRIAYVEPPKTMKLVPELFSALFKAFQP